MAGNKGGGGRPPIDYSSIGKGDTLEGVNNERGKSNFGEAVKRQNKRINKVKIKPQEIDNKAVQRQQDKDFARRDRTNSGKPYENSFTPPKDKTPSAPQNKGGRSGGGRGGGGMFKPFKQFKNKSQQWIKDLLSENEHNQNPAFSKEEKAELLSFMKNEEPRVKYKREFEDPFPITEQDKQEFVLAVREMETGKPAFLDKLDSETPNIDMDSPDMDMGDGDGAV